MCSLNHINFTTECVEQTYNLHQNTSNEDLKKLLLLLLLLLIIMVIFMETLDWAILDEKGRLPLRSTFDNAPFQPRTVMRLAMYLPDKSYWY